MRTPDHLVVDHAAAELLAGGPDHLGVVPRARVELVGADGPAVEPGVRHLVVPGACAVLALPSHPLLPPGLGRRRHARLHRALRLLLGVAAPVGVLPHLQQQ